MSTCHFLCIGGILINVGIIIYILLQPCSDDACIVEINFASADPRQMDRLSVYKNDTCTSSDTSNCRRINLFEANQQKIIGHFNCKVISGHVWNRCASVMSTGGGKKDDNEPLSEQFDDDNNKYNNCTIFVVTDHVSNVIVTSLILYVILLVVLVNLKSMAHVLIKYIHNMQATDVEIPSQKYENSVDMGKQNFIPHTMHELFFSYNTTKKTRNKYKNPTCMSDEHKHDTISNIRMHPLSEFPFIRISFFVLLVLTIVLSMTILGLGIYNLHGYKCTYNSGIAIIIWFIVFILSISGYICDTFTKTKRGQKDGVRKAILTKCSSIIMNSLCCGICCFIILALIGYIIYEYCFQVLIQ